MNDTAINLKLPKLYQCYNMLLQSQTYRKARTDRGRRGFCLGVFSSCRTCWRWLGRGLRPSLLPCYRCCPSTRALERSRWRDKLLPVVSVFVGSPKVCVDLHHAFTGVLVDFHALDVDAASVAQKASEVV